MIALGYIHAILMIGASLVLLSGFIIARYMKNIKWWLKAHKTMGFTGACLILAALLAIVIQISLTGRSHLRIPHSYMGILVVVLAFVAPTLGLMQFKIRNMAAKLRSYHKWLGRIALVLMFINILVGLDIIGVF